MCEVIKLLGLVALSFFVIVLLLLGPTAYYNWQIEQQVNEQIRMQQRPSIAEIKPMLAGHNVTHVEAICSSTGVCSGYKVTADNDTEIIYDRNDLKEFNERLDRLRTC